MFVERKVRHSALFTNLVGWHAGTVSFPLSDVILAQLACSLSDVMFCFAIWNKPTYLSTNIARLVNDKNKVEYGFKKSFISLPQVWERERPKNRFSSFFQVEPKMRNKNVGSSLS